MRDSQTAVLYILMHSFMIAEVRLTDDAILTGSFMIAEVEFTDEAVL